MTLAEYETGLRGSVEEKRRSMKNYRVHFFYPPPFSPPKPQGLKNGKTNCYKAPMTCYQSGLNALGRFQMGRRDVLKKKKSTLLSHTDTPSSSSEWRLRGVSRDRKCRLEEGGSVTGGRHRDS
ncbi:hypothetical protein CDAR_498741 [Caerostris darwini]|uniref:Uncharacterized protein n=1 Tax=Caerostris darwini TaxID=1538125 RepID=A0AAV4SJ65_9ARAC|nr:hypothetical protein CDAR_498741 [Caerostris darwini]